MPKFLVDMSRKIHTWGVFECIDERAARAMARSQAAQLLNTSNTNLKLIAEPVQVNFIEVTS